MLSGLIGCTTDRQSALLLGATPAAYAPFDPAPLPAESGSPQALALAMPDAAEARRLALTSFVRLARAIKAKDFGSLYQTMAPSFRSTVPIERVADGFRPFTASGTDLTTVNAGLLVVAPPPYVNEHGVVIIKGIQPTPTQRWHFEFGFLPVEQGWALTALRLSSTGK